MSVSPAPGVARGHVQMRAVSEDEAGLRLDRWFHRHFPELSHSALQKLLRTGQVRIELLSDGKPKTLNSAYTNVWIKGPKGWQMVAWQSTRLPD